MVLAVVSNCYSKLKGRFPRDTHPCATILTSEDAFSFDLHVLGLPPAFVLSQDQTLKFEPLTLMVLPMKRCSVQLHLKF